MTRRGQKQATRRTVDRTLHQALRSRRCNVPRTEVRGIGGNQNVLGTGQSESMVRWHEQARLRRALSSMWNPGFGSLPLAALGGAALEGGSRAFGRGGLDWVAGGDSSSDVTLPPQAAKERAVDIAREDAQV